MTVANTMTNRAGEADDANVIGYCDHCGRKDDDCSCWMLDPEWTGEVTV